MNLNPINLHFRDHRESEFQTYYYDYSIAFLRISLVFSIVIYLSFFFMDMVVFPENKMQFLIIRLFVCIPIAFLVYLSTIDHLFKPYWQLLVFSMIQLAAIGIIIMISLRTQPFHSNYYVGLLLVCIYNYNLTKLKFLWASFSGWLVFCVYVVFSNYKFDVPYAENYMIISFFMGTNVLGMIASYLFEYYARREFYIIYLLKKERQEVEHLNENLENKVNLRTFELQKVNNELTEKNKALHISEVEINKHKNDLKDLVKKRTLELELKFKELEDKNIELNKFNDLFVGREFRIKELKERIQEQEKKIKELIGSDEKD